MPRKSILIFESALIYLDIIIYNRDSDKNRLTLYYYYNTIKLHNKDCGDVAQMGERYVRNVQVRGSIPLISTIPLYMRDEH
jgi:hypothetical protein